MMKTVTKQLFTSDVLNILGWMEQEDGFFMNAKLPIKIQWGMNKNMTAFRAIRDTYRSFEQKIQQQYSDDEHSYDSVGKDGESVRVVKKEYLDKYSSDMSELLMTENEIDIKQFNIEDFGEIDLGLADMSVLDFFIFDDDVEDTVVE